MPPATNTGTSVTSGRISCASTEVETGPIWPPASMPSMIRASAPLRTSFLRDGSDGAKQTTWRRPPSAALMARARRQAAGQHDMADAVRRGRRRPARSSCGCMTIRLTPNGRPVSACGGRDLGGQQLGRHRRRRPARRSRRPRDRRDQVALRDPGHGAAHDGQLAAEEAAAAIATSRSSARMAPAAKRGIALRRPPSRP